MREMFARDEQIAGASAGLGSRPGQVVGGRENVPGQGARGAGAAYLPQLSFKVTTRLNTGLPGWLSTRSATK